MPDDTIIRNGRLIDAGARSAERRDILVRDGRVLEIGPPGLAAPDDARTFDAAHLLIHPGLVNAHTHGMGNLSKGQADRFSLELLLAGVADTTAFQRRELKYLNTYIGAVEQLTKGCTLAYDLTFGVPLASTEDLIAIGQAYRDAGMRAVVAPMIADLSFFEAIPGLFDALSPSLRAKVRRDGPDDPGTILDAMREALRAWPHDRDVVRLGVAPTIPLHCSDALLTGSARLAREFGAPIQSHVAESKVQAVSGMTRYGRTLAAHIDALGLIGPDFTVAHGVWLDDDDMRRLGDKGASIAHNPGSNMRLGCGIADVRRMLELGVNVALGTDGCNCSDNQNMYEAMRYASMASSVRGPDFTRWLGAPEIVHAATLGGARATGFHGAGRIAPGSLADMVFLDAHSVNWMPVNDPANQLVLTEDATGVRHVMVGGDWIVQGGRHLRCDMAALAARAEAARDELAALTLPFADVAAEMERAVGAFCIGLARRPYHVDRFATRDA